MNDPGNRRRARHGRQVRAAMKAGAVLSLRACAVGALGVAALPLLGAGPVSASTVTSAVFSGGAGTASVGGTLYAHAGAALTLSVVTSNDTKCVDVAGAVALPRQTSSTAKTSWTFATTAPIGNGAQAFTVAASPNFNANNCTGQTNSTQSSYTLDNTGPIVTAALTPAANAAGWNNTNTTVAWTAADSGSGVGSGPTPASSTENANGSVTRTSSATDKVGNIGNGSVTVRVDKTAPTITAAQVTNADGTTTITFTCNDSPSGIATCVASGSTTNSKTVQPGVTVTGTATDGAGNIATATSTAPAGDTTAPVLSGAPTTSPNGDGWYAGNVTVHWTATDPDSGVPTAPADTTITGEGTALTSTTTVTNGAGLVASATSSPAVKIDRTAPSTAIAGSSNDWTNGSVTVSLSASDNLSTVAKTEYTIDGAASQTGTTFVLSTEGDHTVTFHSTDKAGNAEPAQTAHVKIDKTAPTISHAFAPLTYTDGAWTNTDVTVTFSCDDQGGSGLASCTSPVTESFEGSHTVTGTATDAAGNATTNDATVRIDKTAPTITATAGGIENAAGWYQADVTVTYSANDALSGISSTPANQILGEGANQEAHATVTDAAGNDSSATVTGINIDKTNPALTGTYTPGWHTGDVTVAWTCTDTLSGPAAQPAASIVSGEGDNLSAAATCSDVAGNATTTTVTGIHIDRTAPTTTNTTVATTSTNGWYTGAVHVTLNATDNLSPITTTNYTIDGSPTHNYTGPFTYNTEGTHTIAFWSTDEAGNTETTATPLILNIDTITPSTTVINPISPDSGWFVTSGIPVAFDANDAGSGIAATYYTIDGGATHRYGQPFTAELSSGSHTITYWSVDLAGNEEAHATTNTIAIKVDTDAPTISGAATPAPNSFGWNNTSVDVTFTCDDIGLGASGVAGCSGNTTLVNDGAGQSVSGDAVDVAGNTNNASVGGINIDQLEPTLSGAPTTLANAVGWYKGDVSIAWTGNDNLSGIDPATQPANSTIIGEGSNLTAGPVTIGDKAGNVSDSTSVTGVKIDRTAPTIAGVLPGGYNAAGWYQGDVVVGFTCADPTLADGTAGSGVAACPSDVMLKGDGANQSVTSAAAADMAGNASTGKTVIGINIDGHEPQTTADNQCTATNGYCKGATATVVLSSTDTGPSGVKEIHYTVNGGAEQVAAGASKTVNIPTDGTGHATFTYYGVDNAGNIEAINRAGLDYDNIAPTVTHTVTPAANAADWNNSNVTIHFDAKDTDPGSSVDTASVTPNVTVSSETTSSGMVVNGSAKDVAGNVGTDSVRVRLDKTAPSITGAIVPGTTIVNGWYTGSVKVHFICSDALSGVGVCPDDVMVTSNGANQSVTRSATDIAGNIAGATVSGITIDSEKPTITSVNVANGSYTLGAVPAATCTATDSFSGVSTCKVTTTGGNANGVGIFTYTAIATDNAGNTSAALTGTYAVTYRFDGFLQPINDTAHQVGVSTSIFKAGSTVPVKFQLKNAAGQVVSANTAPMWLTPVKGSAMNASVDESVYTASADSGSTYRSDAQQYIYNWKTGTGGTYWRIGVTFDDGQTYFVNIGLR